MPGHGKADPRISAEQQMASMTCWQNYLIWERIYELQAGVKVEIGNFSHCIRRYQSPLSKYDVTPIQRIARATSSCPVCRYETTRFKDSIYVYGWRTKLSRSAVIALMAEALDTGAARGGMVIEAKTVRYTVQEAQENAVKPKPRQDEDQEPAAAPARAQAPMPAPMEVETGD